MDLEPEVARQQMEETRSSLSDKLESLEQQVVDTVQGATSAVSDTVDNVKDAVEGTVKSVQDTLNLRRQVRRHPWGMMLGSVALGYVGGYFLFKSGKPQPATNGWKSLPASPESPRTTARLNGVAPRPRSMERAAEGEALREGSPGPSEPGWLRAASNQFEPEIARLKGMAIGAVLNVVRDLIARSVSGQLNPELAEVLDSVKAKLSGEPGPDLAPKAAPVVAPGPAGAGSSGGDGFSFRSP